MRLKAVVLLAFSVLFLSVPSAGSASGGRLEEALTLYAQAQAIVGEHHKRCQPQPPDEAPTVESHGRPQAGLLGSLAVLRRRGTRADRVVGIRKFGFFQADSRVYVDYTRIVHSSDGHQFVMMAVRTPLHPQVTPAFCTMAVDHQVARLDHRQSPAVRNQVLMIEQNAASMERLRIEDSRYDAAWLEDYPVPNTSSGAPYPTIRSRGVLFLAGSNAAGNSLEGIVPDGVATITVSIPRTTRFGTAKVTNPFSFSRTAPVRDNVLHLALHRAVAGLVFCQVTWRTVTGGVIARFVTFVFTSPLA